MLAILAYELKPVYSPKSLKPESILGLFNVNFIFIFSIITDHNPLVFQVTVYYRYACIHIQHFYTHFIELMRHLSSKHFLTYQNK